MLCKFYKEFEMKNFATLYIIFRSTWLLLQSTVSMDDINTVERLLQHFCSKFSLFYGMNMYTR